MPNTPPKPPRPPPRNMPVRPRHASPTHDSAFPGGAKQQTNQGKDARSHLWTGRIVHVDVETMVCSVALQSGTGERHDVPLTAPGGGGPRSWSGIIPEPGTRVLLGWKRFDNRNSYSPYIVEYLTSGVFPAREYEPFSTVDPADAQAILNDFPDFADDPHVSLGVVRLKARKGYSGDFVTSSSSGTDLIMDRDFFATNRAGNEMRLRDSDQTFILQTRNEFTSNSAGYYRRGLIKRNAFNFLPDLYPLDPITGLLATVITPGDPTNGLDSNGDPLDRNPAYNTLLEFGLIREDGTKNFEDDPDAPFYPPVVHADGQYTSYVTELEPEFSFNDTPSAYIEDRIELRHRSDGIMAVTEDGDGFQIDAPYPVFIEDVKGTYVGNDFHSDAGRPLYKRILGLKVFDSPDQARPAAGPVFEPIDTVSELNLIDDHAIARLFRVQSPTSANQFCFGVTKEGKVILHVPKTLVGTPDEKGKSIDANIVGAIKAVIGADENSQNQSIDVRMTGGANIEIGRFGQDPNNPNLGGESIRLVLHGGITRTHNADPKTGHADVSSFNGNTVKTTTGSAVDIVNGNSIRNSGGQLVDAGYRIAQQAGSGGMATTVSGDVSKTVLGKTQEQYALLHTSMFALGKTITTVAGVDSSTVLAGAITRTVAVGPGITDTVATGNFVSSVGAGNWTANVGAGSLSATVGAGALALTASAGPLSLTSSLILSATAGVLMKLTAPITSIGVVPVGFAVAGAPGPPSVHFDYLIGIPILGISNVTLG